jgi:hypothetical protein
MRVFLVGTLQPEKRLPSAGLDRREGWIELAADRIQCLDFVKVISVRDT